MINNPDGVREYTKKTPRKILLNVSARLGGVRTPLGPALRRQTQMYVSLRPSRSIW